MTNQQNAQQTPQTGYVKRALRADGKGGLFVLCECGNKVSIPVIKGMPMTYECLCGIVYDNAGWIVEKKETRRMTCAVCGDYAGKWQQHHNRDTGFGICVRCVKWLRDEKRCTEEEIVNLYGVEGKNWGNQ